MLGSWRPVHTPLIYHHHCCSVTKSRSTLWPHELCPTKLLCPPLSAGVCSNSPVSRWWYLTFHLMLSPSLFSFNLSQHQGLFQWVGSSHQVVKVLKLQLQYQSFQGTFRVNFLKDWLVWSSCSPRDSQESSRHTVQKHQFFSAQPSFWSNSYICT